MFATYSFLINISNFLENAIKQGQSPSIISLEHDILQYVNLVLHFRQFVLKVEKHVPIVLLSLHNWTYESLQNFPHIVFVLVEIELVIVLNVDLKLLGINLIVEAHECLPVMLIRFPIVVLDGALTLGGILRAFGTALGALLQLNRRFLQALDPLLSLFVLVFDFPVDLLVQAGLVLTLLSQSLFGLGFCCRHGVLGDLLSVGFGIWGFAVDLRGLLRPFIDAIVLF